MFCACDVVRVFAVARQKDRVRLVAGLPGVDLLPWLSEKNAATVFQGPFVTCSMFSA